MSDKSELLASLKIEREPETDRGGSKWIALTLIALVLIAVIATAGWSLTRGGDAVAIRTAIATSASSRSTAGLSVLDASGYIVARRSATVSAKITGKVTEVMIEEGQRVEAGDIIATLEDTNEGAQLALAQAQLAAARSELAQLEVRLRDARRIDQRNRELAAQGLVSEAVRDSAHADAEALAAQLEAAKESVKVAERSVDVRQRQLDETVVRAPFSGIVTVKAAQVGEIVSPLSAGGGFTRTGIGTIVDMDSLEIEVDVNENFINRVTPDQNAQATLNAYPDWKIPARVIAVIPTADRSKATIKVRVAILEKDARILPEMGVRVAFLGEDAPAEESLKGVFVPRQSVLEDEGQPVVFLVRGNQVERRAVTTGLTRGDRIQIVAGLTPGDRVATGPVSELSDGAAVTIGD
ncbi:efflux RND transporter periplasmic adaptor subunit [uncultured Abyssibacter sp.]|uniref:efflux RND transporter periplasmic adaptor subunit n=1 Tax=uncultured Abyssibacter sp. TaxID=2320202 RepID=UPI0032B16454